MKECKVYDRLGELLFVPTNQPNTWTDVFDLDDTQRWTELNKNTNLDITNPVHFYFLCICPKYLGVHKFEQKFLDSLQQRNWGYTDKEGAWKGLTVYTVR